MLATLFNVFTDERGMGQFSFANADLHRRQNTALRGLGAAPIDYVLDPIPPGENAEAWLQTHQQAHTQVNTLLGIVGNDLSDVDFKNPDQVASWVWLHAQEHRQATAKLGIT